MENINYIIKFITLKQLNELQRYAFLIEKNLFFLIQASDLCLENISSFSDEAFAFTDEYILKNHFLCYFLLINNIINFLIK